jgi:alkylhydroperoxidase family enzyme
LLTSGPRGSSSTASAPSRDRRQRATARDGHGQNAREDALLGLVRRVVRTGGAGTGTELAALREAGVSDREVVEVLAHVALKAFTNAVALVAQTEIDFPKQPRLPSA